MIERQFINQKTKEFYIKKYIEEKLSRAGVSQIKLKKIPLGEKIIIYTSRPSLIVGSKGANIRDLTKALKKDFKLENPQIEISEITNAFLDANVVAERIAGSLERFGSARFKGIGHKAMENVMNAGALGIEVLISGKIPGARAKSLRFYQGYLKKCGVIAISGVIKAQKAALLKSGIIGIKVSIMPPNVRLPDDIDILPEPIKVVEEVKGESEEEKGEKGSKAEKKRIKKRSVKKKSTAEKTSANEKTSEKAGGKASKDAASEKDEAVKEAVAAERAGAAESLPDLQEEDSAEMTQITPEEAINPEEVNADAVNSDQVNGEKEQ